MKHAYFSNIAWNRHRPKTLVVACSDGRLQENLDDFLEKKLGITHYDRLYLPGGAGALAASGLEPSRANQFREECRHLFHAHGIALVIFLLHGPAIDGPEEAICADYRRKMPTCSLQEIRHQQELDAAEIVQAFRWEVEARMAVYRCEVRGDDRIQFVLLAVSG